MIPNCQGSCFVPFGFHHTVVVYLTLQSKGREAHAEKGKGDNTMESVLVYFKSRQGRLFFHNCIQLKLPNTPHILLTLYLILLYNIIVFSGDWKENL